MKTAYAPPCFGRRVEPTSTIIAYSPLTSETFFYRNVLTTFYRKGYNVEKIIQIRNCLIEEPLTTPEKVMEKIPDITVEDICYVINQFAFERGVLVC